MTRTNGMWMRALLFTDDIFREEDEVVLYLGRKTHGVKVWDVSDVTLIGLQAQGAHTNAKRMSYSKYC
jgi:hypothetical protein